MLSPPPTPEPTPSGLAAVPPALAAQVKGLMREASLRLDEVETSGAVVRADLPAHVTPAGPSAGPAALPSKPVAKASRRGIVVAQGWGRTPEG